MIINTIIFNMTPNYNTFIEKLNKSKENFLEIYPDAIYEAG